jgi:hypothetical protein
MFVREKTFGQIDAATSAAISTPEPGAGLSPVTYFLLAVSAGVTVFFITRWLGGRRR